MPFNFLKKSRHYNVTSKSLFVISVHHLLDPSTTVDCTLSSESTGQECLDNVCQRLSINQPEFFGLRYFVKGSSSDEQRWVDLERPLSRQLEKYASGCKLFLRVQYYIISGVSLLEDEQSRYYYFLQLKSDVAEGRLLCDTKQSILLALYCRQAEYDCYQKDKNTLEYLKTLLPFHQHAIDESLHENIVHEILKHNPGLQNLTQSAAEEWFITICQQVDGYGQEKFWVKDSHGNSVQLGLSINGIAVISQNSVKFYPWHEVKNVINLKRTFNIEQEGKNVISFTFSEAEIGRYFWRLCVLQHLFYSKYEVGRTNTPSIQQNLPTITTGQTNGNGNIISQQQQQFQQQQPQRQQSVIATQSTNNLFLNYSGDCNDSQEDLLNEHLYCPSANNMGEIHHQIVEKKNSLISSNLSLTNSQYIQQQQQQQSQHHSSHQLLQHAPSSILHSHTNISTQDYQQQQQQGHHFAGHSTTTLGNGPTASLSTSQILEQIDPTRLQSTSCLDLSSNNYGASNQDKDRLKALLPSYRPAPDYETAVQQKYRASSNEIQMIRVPSTAALYAQAAAAAVTGSQPDVHNVPGQVAQQQQQQHQHFPDILTQNTCPVLPSNHPINANLYSNVDLVQRLHMMRLKPPPPYSANRLSSTSTPDLAVAASLRTTPLGYRTNAYVSGSSPDLVSTRTFLNTQYSTPIQYSYLNSIGHSQPYLPGTFDNLNMIEEQPQAILLQLKKPVVAAATAQTLYDSQVASIQTQQMYRHQKNNLQQQQQQQHQQVQQHQNEINSNLLHKSAINGSIEPIYENVPFPYASNSSVNNNNQHNNGSTVIPVTSEMRNRTSSIQSAPSGTPGIIEATNANVLVNINRRQSNEFVRQQQQQQQLQQQYQQALQQQFISNDESTINQGSYSLHKSAIEVEVNIQQQQQQHISQQQQYQSQQELQQAQQLLTNCHISNSNATAGHITGHHSSEFLHPQSKTSAPATTNSIKYHNDQSHHETNYDFSSHQNKNKSNKKHQQPSSTSSSFLNSSNISTSTTVMDSSIASSNVSTNTKEKRKKRWGILGGRSKNSSSNSSTVNSDKKSATLGREKSKNKQKEEEALQESNLRHRWSTGLPKLQPLSASYSKDKLCQILDTKLNDSQLFIEFEGILKRREGARYLCALLDENKNKNNDPMFLPYDDNRVRITPTLDNRHGYVNASYISATVGVNQRFYIVGQSPFNSQTTQLFWQCVWEADVYFIVQLSDEVNYIPPTTNKSIECGQFQIYQEFSQITDRCTTSKLRMYHQQTKRQRSVWHLNFNDWAEQNCPRDVNIFLDFLEDLSSVRQASINEVPPGHNSNPPVFIHCREGAGRSGVTLVADLLLYTLDHNQDLDIPRVIGQLRQQRDNLIPSLAQYKFIYALLINYLKRTRLI